MLSAPAPVTRFRDQTPTIQNASEEICDPSGTRPRKRARRFPFGPWPCAPERSGEVLFGEVWGENGRILDAVEWGYDVIARWRVDADFAPQLGPQPHEADTSELLGNTCRKRFRREVADPESLLTLYDNMHAPAIPDNAVYARVTVKEGVPQRFEGSFIRHQGILMVQVFGPLHEGM